MILVAHADAANRDHEIVVSQSPLERIAQSRRVVEHMLLVDPLGPHLLQLEAGHEPIRIANLVGLGLSRPTNHLVTRRQKRNSRTWLDPHRIVATACDYGQICRRKPTSSMQQDSACGTHLTGAAHMALSWVTSESLSVDPGGEIHDLTVRSFGILRAIDMPRVEITIE